jgi:Leucine-rich repeat (LRR) protein
LSDNEITTRPANFKENLGSFGQETVDLFSGNFNKIKECGTEKIHYLDNLRKLNLQDKDLTDLK